MGASVSSNVSQTDNQTITNSVNQCNKGVASNTLFIQGFKHDPLPSCQNPSFNVNQSASVDATCFINAMQDGMAQSLTNLNANTTAGFGLSGSSNVNDSKQKIVQNLQNICGGASSTQLVAAKDIETKACNVVFVQNATAQTACQISALQDATIQTDSTLQAQSAGASLASFIFGSNLGISMMMLIAIIVVVGGGYLIFKNYGSGTEEPVEGTEGTDITSPDLGTKPGAGIETETETETETLGGKLFGGFGEFNSENYSMLIIIIILFMAVIFIAFSRSSNNKITMSDFGNFQNKISQAKKIAGLEQSDQSEQSDDSYLSEPLRYNPIRPKYTYWTDEEYPQYSWYERQTVSPIPTNLFPISYTTKTMHHNTLDSYYRPLIDDSPYNNTPF